MTPHVPRSEAALEALLVGLVRAAGGEAYKWSSPAMRGVPDRLCVFPGGRVVAVELKGPRGRVSSLQQRAMQRLAALGLPMALVRCAADIEQMLQEIAHA